MKRIHLRELWLTEIKHLRTLDGSFQLVFWGKGNKELVIHCNRHDIHAIASSLWQVIHSEEKVLEGIKHTMAGDC